MAPRPAGSMAGEPLPLPGRHPAPIEDDAPFEMANLRPSTTGLPFVVFVSQQGGARHGACVKISPLPRYDPAEAITVTLERPPRAIGDISGRDLELIKTWIELNRDTLEAYWSGEIAFTEDMVSRIKSV